MTELNYSEVEVPTIKKWVRLFGENPLSKRKSPGKGVESGINNRTMGLDLGYLNMVPPKK